MAILSMMYMRRISVVQGYTEYLLYEGIKRYEVLLFKSIHLKNFVTFLDNVLGLTSEVLGLTSEVSKTSKVLHRN